MSSLQKLLKESWALVEADQDRVASYFYARIFLSYPQLRDLFPVAMDLLRARMLAAIVSVIETVDDPEAFDSYLKALGRDHRKFRVVPEHFAAVGAALLEALRTFAGEGWSVEYDRAWTDAYAVIADRMQAGAAADTNPPFWHAEVVRHERRSRDIAVFTVQTMQPLDYRAGQHLSMETHHQPRLWRMFAPANSPRKDNTIDFHVRAIDSGFVSGALVRRLRPGHMVKLAAPQGSTTLDRRSTKDIVCVANDIGLAPAKALIDELTRYNRTRWVHLFIGARDREDLYDLAELNQLAARHPWLSVVPAVTDEPGFGGETGPIADVVARYGPWEQHDFFVTGSKAMVSATLRRLAEMKVPSVRIKYDSFGEV